MTTVQALKLVRNMNGSVIDEKVLHLKTTGLDDFCSRLSYDTFKANSGMITEENRELIKEYADKLYTLYGIIEGILDGDKDEGTGYLVQVGKLLAPHILISAVGVGFNFTGGYRVSEHNICVSACITPLDAPDYTISLKL